MPFIQSGAFVDGVIVAHVPQEHAGIPCRFESRRPDHDDHNRHEAVFFWLKCARLKTRRNEGREKVTFKLIETQEDFDAAIKAAIEAERAKFSGYEDFKKKAEAFDKAEADRKDALEKAREEIDRLKADAKKREEADAFAALKGKVSKETGVPSDLIAGDDEESMTAFANAVKAWSKKPSAPKVEGDGGFALSFDKKSDKAEFVEKLFGDSK